MRKSFAVNRKYSLIFAFLVVGILIAVTFINISLDIKNKCDFKQDGYIFEALSDLDFLDGFVTESKVIDKHAPQKGVGRCLEVLYKNKRYKVYGYVFDTEEDAWSYAEKYSGTNYKDLTESFGKSDVVSSKSSSLFGINAKRTTVIVSECNVLIITGQGNSKDYYSFISFLMEKLPRKLEGYGVI